MSDRLSGIVDAVRVKVEEELRQQLGALTAEHERALEEALRAAARTSERQAQESEARWSTLLAEARAGAQQMAESAVTAARAEFESERQAARSAASTWTAGVDAELGGATTVTEILNRLADAVSRETRGALLVSRRGTLERWPLRGSDELSGAWTAAAAAALHSLEPHSQGGARAVPLVLDRTAIGVLVAPEDTADPSRLHQLALTGAARLATVTARRLVQADRWMAGSQHPAIATDR